MLYKELTENESVQRLIRDKQGSAVITIKGGLSALHQKTAITSTSISSAGNDATTSGVKLFDRSLPFAPLARRRLWIRDLLTVVPMELGAAEYVKEETAISDASPQTEASAKLENAVTFTTATAVAKTISTWIPASRQILDDLPGLQSFIETSLLYAVLKKEQDHVFVGNNTGEQLNGISNQATAFDTSLLVAGDGWEYLDCIGRAAQQLEVAEYSQPNFVAVHPTTYWAMRLAKDTTGKYVLGDPSVPNVSIFGLTPIRTAALTTSQFIVGSSEARDIVLRERQEFRISIAASHNTDFTENKVTILGEERVALAIFRPGSFVYGAPTQSPA